MEPSENPSVAGDVLHGLLENAKQRVTPHLYGWILDAIGIGSGSDPVISRLDRIQQTLDLIETQIVALQVQLREAEKAIILAVQWNSQTAAISDQIAGIDYKFRQLHQLQKDDRDQVAQLQKGILDTNDGVGPALQKINNFILDGEGGVSPGQAGLLNMWIQSNSDAAMANFQRGNVGAGTPLDAAAHAITKYFLFLVVEQLKGTTLLVNAYAAAKEPNLVEDALTTYQTNLATQAELYRAGMEQLLLRYCSDQTLLGLFAGPHWATSPALLADSTICGVIGRDELVLRIWGGRQTQGLVFDTGTLITDGRPGPALQLTGGSSPIAAEVPTGESRVFSTSSASWSMYRYRFPSPAPGSYQITPGIPSLPFFNCWIDPTQRFRKYVMENPTIPIASDRKAAGMAMNFTGTNV